ncbi:hypothetical protein DMC30DRAFT_116237 [Rhodotorula diobovata]|uniref:Allergen n=1 Tax=Rhodotorula diobovata TaxID=5288 RepID=A0A5C5G128_9BASI|nr:hypothetical protein DMC30DRAFT_116237 [Rhodotorula diobovata]
MNKLKQVFSHDDNKETTEGRGAPYNTASSTGDAAQTPTHSSAGDRVDLADDVPSRSHGTHGTHDSHNTHNTGLTSGTAATTGATGTHQSTGSKVAEGVEHLKEHAAPPAHRHHQPTKDAILSEADAKAATHDHQHLAPVTHETRQLHEVEEIERQREVDRHVHHVQHHVQPVLDTQHQSEVHRENAVAPTKITERHVATDEDKAQFASLASGAKDTVVEAGKERVIVDKGEHVRENVSHHVHHVVQPQIERDVHEHHRIHTVVPIHQTTHEAPVVHASVLHEPLKLDDFVAGGGDLKSTLKHDADSLLNRGECERTVDGPAESLVQSLGLSSINDKNASTTGATTTGASTTGTTPSATTGANPASTRI